MKIIAFPIEKYRLGYDAALSELELARAQHLCAMSYHEIDHPWRMFTFDRYQIARALVAHVRRFGVVNLPEVRVHGTD